MKQYSNSLSVGTLDTVDKLGALNTGGPKERNKRRNRRKRSELFLDVGSNKISGVLVELGDDTSFDIISKAELTHGSITAGQIINHKDFANALVTLIDEIENNVGTRAEIAHLACSSPSIDFTTEEASKFIGGGVVKENDISLLINSIRAQSSKESMRVIYDALIDVSLDGVGGVSNAEGLFCHSVEVKMVRQSISEATCINFERTFKQIDLPLITIENSASVAGNALLTSEERKQGAILVDFGHTTTSVVIFAGGHPVTGVVFPVGGKSVTDDLAKCLPVTAKNAEAIKRQHAAMCLFGSEALFTLQDMRMSPTLDEKPITKREVSEIVKPRVMEIFEMLKRYLDNNEHPGALARTAAVCGHASQLKEFDTSIQEVINRHWRFVSEVEYKGYILTPALLGLLKTVVEEERDPFSGPLRLSHSMWQRLKLWLRYHV